MSVFRRLTDVSLLERYIHLRYVNVAQNNIDNVHCLSAMSNLVSVDVSKNRLRHLQLEELPYLQTADFSHNKLATLESLSQPLLARLNVSCECSTARDVMKQLCSLTTLI